MVQKRTVFVVDNDPSHRDAIRHLAESMGLACETYESGLSFLSEFDRERLGCLVLDVRIADLSGLQIQQRLRGEGSLLPLVFVSAHGTVSTVVRALKAGAIGFFEYPFEEHELWDAIQSSIRLHEQRRTAAQSWSDRASRVATLTPREMALLRHLVSGKRNREIAAQLEVSVRTVEVRRSRLLKKLKADSLFDLFRTLEAITPRKCFPCTEECAGCYLNDGDLLGLAAVQAQQREPVVPGRMPEFESGRSLP